MPLHLLDVSPADVSGTRLRLALNAPAPAPLAVCSLSHPDGGVVVLGVLGASHIITVEAPNARFSEEVSCTTRADSPLPERAVASGYRLQSHTSPYDAANFHRLAHSLRERCADDEAWLGGAFPGDDAALTVLAAQPDGVGWQWQTWHLYPDSAGGGTVVHTTSRWRP